MNRSLPRNELRSMNAALRWALAGLIALGLGIDAYTHVDLAHLYVYNTTGTVNEAVLFRVEAAAAVVAGLWVLLRPGLWSAALASLVAGGGAFALLLYRYVNVGKIGPIPNMYDPGWFTKKELSLAGELVALVAALALVAGSLIVRRRVRHSVMA